MTKRHTPSETKCHTPKSGAKYTTPKKRGRKRLYANSHRASILMEDRIWAELEKRAAGKGLGTGEYLNRYLARKWRIPIRPRETPITHAYVRKSAL